MQIQHYSKGKNEKKKRIGLFKVQGLQETLITSKQPMATIRPVVYILKGQVDISVRPTLSVYQNPLSRRRRKNLKSKHIKTSNQKPTENPKQNAKNHGSCKLFKNSTKPLSIFFDQTLSYLSKTPQKTH